MRIHKFGFLGRFYLLAYEVDKGTKSIYIYAVGGHENFYRDLKQYLKS
jgi:mRNA-degrading endonuclease RelE of RelBE toxin-antitoxin system